MNFTQPLLEQSCGNQELYVALPDGADLPSITISDYKQADFFPEFEVSVYPVEQENCTKEAYLTDLTPGKSYAVLDTACAAA